MVRPEFPTAEIRRGVPLAANSGEILARLEKSLLSHRISPHPACRFAKYRKIFQARNYGTMSAAPTQEQLYATAELFQMDWIVSCFAQDDALWPAIERAFFRDPAVPSHTNVHSPGRDLQFELYVAARLTMAGLSPVFAEPDIRADLVGWPFGVAVKRVKSRPALIAAIRQARDQISRHELDGIVALDYSFIAASDNSPYASGDLDAACAWMQQFSEREFHPVWPKIQKIVSKCQHVIGIIIITRLLHLHPDHHTHQISELMFSRPTCVPSDRRFDAFIAIEERLSTSVLPPRLHAVDV